MAGTLTVQNLQGPSSGANANKIIVPSGQTLYAPGHVISVNRIHLDTEQTTATTSFIDVSNGSVTVTPKSSSSTFLVSASCHAYTNSAGVGAWSSLIIRLMRDTVDLGGSFTSDPYFDALINPSGNEAMHQPLISRSDSPNTTSAITYKVQVFTKNGRAMTANRYARGFLEVIEVAG